MELTGQTQELRAQAVLNKLHGSEESFRQIAESNPLGLIAASRVGGLSFENTSLLSLIGYTEEELAAGLVVLQPGKCLRYEKVYIAKGGRHIPILMGVPFGKQ